MFEIGIPFWNYLFRERQRIAFQILKKTLVHIQKEADCLCLMLFNCYALQTFNQMLFSKIGFPLFHFTYQFFRYYSEYSLGGISKRSIWHFCVQPLTLFGIDNTYNGSSCCCRKTITNFDEKAPESISFPVAFSEIAICIVFCHFQERAVKLASQA